MAQPLNPRDAFPEEVVRLHDEQGVPWPDWYCGPLNIATAEDTARALALLAEVRVEAVPPGPQPTGGQE